MRKKFFGVCSILAALPVIGAAFLTGCGKQVVQEIPELIEAVGVDMDTAEVIRMDLKGIVSYPAQIVPRIEEIAFLSSGRLDAMKMSINRASMIWICSGKIRNRCKSSSAEPKIPV